MAIITLTSDLGLKGYYVSAVKGAILKLLPDTTIVDISHDIQTFDIAQTAFILGNSYPNFPEGTIHIIGVNAFPDFEAANLLIKANEQYFIGVDNGVFSLLLNGTPEKIIALNPPAENTAKTFPMRDVFVQVACQLAQGAAVESFGQPVDSLLERTTFQPYTDQNSIRGMVIYVDAYENLITNITKETFDLVGQGRPFTIDFRSNEISELSQSYNDVVDGEILALFNTSGLLEIAQKLGKFSTLLGVGLAATISVTFNDHPNS